MCTEGIFRWDERLITLYCNFRKSHKNEYKAISIDKKHYVLHPKIVPYYFETCDFSEPENVTLDSSVYSELIELRPNCDILIPHTKQKLIAPYSEIKNPSQHKQLIT